MEVILKDNVEHVGYTDDLVSVKAGYARNYLIPRGLAVAATESAKKVRNENLKQKAHKKAKLVEEAEAMVAKLTSASIKVSAKVGEEGKIFGSINTVQLAEAIKEAGVSVERKNIKITNEPIKSIGSYEAVVKLHRDVNTTITFEVVGE